MSDISNSAENWVAPERAEPSSKPKRSRIRNLFDAGVVALGTGTVALIGSPANEAGRANFGFDRYVATGSTEQGALAVMIATVALESTSTLIVGACINYRPDAFDKILNARSKKKDTTPLEDDNPEINTIKSRLVDLTIMTALGPGLIIPRRRRQEGNRNFKKDMKTGFGYVGIGTALSGAIGWVVFGGSDHADKIGIGDQVSYAADIAADWRSWGLAAVAYKGTSKLAQVRNNRKERKTIDKNKQL